MDDTELVKMAAKGAGYYICCDLEYLGLNEWGGDIWIKEDKFLTYRKWNPLLSDADAFTLLATIAQSASFRLIGGKTFHGNNVLLDMETSAPKSVQGSSVTNDINEVASAMRRLIVQAAAEIGIRTK